MLSIFYGEYKEEDYIGVPDIYFNNTYEDEWIEDELSKKMIEDVDGSKVVGPHLIDSPFLGGISPERLSGGVKTLILMNQDTEHVFNASACGDNCAKWILEIGRQKNIKIRLGYLMNFGENAFEVELANNGQIVHNLAELNEAVLRNRFL